MSDNLYHGNVCKSNNVNEHEKSFIKTDNTYWSPGTAAIVGDSIGNSIGEKRLSMNNRNVKAFHFSRARIRDISQLIQPKIKKKPEFLILHVGINDANIKDSRKIVDYIPLLKSAILKSLLDSRVIVSEPTFRGDNSKAAPTIGNFNKHLLNLETECIKNDNRNARNLSKKDLRLNTKGKDRLTLNFLNQIRKF